jgi:hypothetical protein
MLIEFFLAHLFDFFSLILMIGRDKNKTIATSDGGISQGGDSSDGRWWVQD